MKKTLLTIVAFSVQNSDTMTKDISTYMKNGEKIDHLFSPGDLDNPLFKFAAGDEYLPITTKILDYGVSVEGYSGHSPLHVAVDKGALLTVTKLLAHNIDPNTRSDKLQATPIELACQVLNRPTSNYGEPAPFRTTCFEKTLRNIEIIRALLDKKANPKSMLFFLMTHWLALPKFTGPQQETLIFINKEIIGSAFKNGLNIWLKNNENKTALENAAGQHGANPSQISLVNYVYELERQKVLKVVRYTVNGPKARSPFKLLPKEICEMIIKLAYPVIVLPSDEIHEINAQTFLHGLA